MVKVHGVCVEGKWAKWLANKNCDVLPGVRSNCKKAPHSDPGFRCM